VKSASCIYEGQTRHRRFETRSHEFRFPLFMMYVDLTDIDRLFEDRWFWSSKRFNLAWFRRSDHLGPPEQPLDKAVRDLVAGKTGVRPQGPIRLLTHFRYFGFLINPISLYYCFDNDEQLQFAVAEVTNTPWGERHNYVIDVRDMTRAAERPTAEKQMHVSPFFGMDYQYRFFLRKPAETLMFGIGMFRKKAVHDRIRTVDRPENRAPAFQATLQMRRRPINRGELTRVLIRYPFMTMQVFAGIYWHALRLWWKKVPFVPHPERTPKLPNAGTPVLDDRILASSGPAGSNSVRLKPGRMSS
jgi:uncharacterized protein